MFIAVINNNTNLYFNVSDFIKDTFYPDTIINGIVNFRISGKNYSEKKENLRNIAIDFQIIDNGGLSYSELSIINNFLEENARRYGLVSEFKENGIV